MKITGSQLAIINTTLQIDNEGKLKTFATIADLTNASEIFKAIMKNTDPEAKMFLDGEIKLTSEHKVFLTRLIDEKNWSVGDAENVLSLKELLK